MGLNIWRQGSWLVAEISGDLDIASVPLIRVRLDQTLSDQIVCGLILDLTGVSFLDSSGLGFVLGRYRHLAKKRRKMIVTGLHGQVERVFKLSGLTNIIPKKKTLTEALRAVKEDG